MSLSTLLLLEGCEQHLWDMLLEDAKMIADNKRTIPGYRVEKVLSRQLPSGLVSAHLALDPTGTGNKALECSLKATDLPGAKGESYWISLGGANVILRKHLNTSHCKPCDPRLFDRGTAVYKWTHSPGKAGQQIAVRMLFHPTSPDPNLLYRLLNAENGPEEFFMLENQRTDSITKLGTLALRGAYLFSVLRDDEKARFIEQVVEMHIPRAWRWRHQLYAEFAQDPKLQHLNLHGTRRQARHGNQHQCGCLSRSGDEGTSSNAHKLDHAW